MSVSDIVYFLALGFPMSDYGLLLIFATQSIELLIQLIMLSMVLRDRRNSIESVRELVHMLQKKLK